MNPAIPHQWYFAYHNMRKNNVATLEELVEAAKALEDIRQALD